jgi:hypothetical protein
MNKALESPLRADRLTMSFERWWPELERKLNAMPLKPTAAAPARTVDSMIEELLSAVREQTKSIGELMAASASDKRLKEQELQER